MLAAQPLFQWSYVTGQWGAISSDLLQHISLSLLALGFGLVISQPLALAAWRFRILRAPVIGFASALYIIPSLALFAILGPITGYVASYPTAEIALVGYTLLILIWNTVAGLDAVPADAREAATALGYSTTRRLVRVDLPLALPYVFAGLARGGRHGHRARHRDRAHRPRWARPADHLRIQHRLLHAHHRGPGPVGAPRRSVRPPPGRAAARRRPVVAVPPSEPVNAMEMT